MVCAAEAGGWAAKDGRRMQALRENTQPAFHGTLYRPILSLREEGQAARACGENSGPRAGRPNGPTRESRHRPGGKECRA